MVTLLILCSWGGSQNGLLPGAVEIRRKGGSDTTCNSYTQHEMAKSVTYFSPWENRGLRKFTDLLVSSGQFSLSFPLVHFLSCFEKPLHSNCRNCHCVYAVQVCEGIRRGREKIYKEKMHVAILLDRHIKFLSLFFLWKVGKMVCRSCAGQLHYLLYCLH